MLKFLHACMQGVYKQMVEAFRSLGVETVSGVGTPFDPEVHEAIMREERDDIPDGTVLKEFRRGFRLGSQLLRAAMVQVALGSNPHLVVFLFVSLLSGLGRVCGTLSACPLLLAVSFLFRSEILETCPGCYRFSRHVHMQDCELHKFKWISLWVCA